MSGDNSITPYVNTTNTPKYYEVICKQISCQSTARVQTQNQSIALLVIKLSTEILIASTPKHNLENTKILSKFSVVLEHH